MPTEITIFDENGAAVYQHQVHETMDNSAFTAYSAPAIGEGRLVYGHYGRFVDFVDLQR